MKKKVLKTTFFLLVISAVSKLLSFLVRIVTARILCDEAISYVSLVNPVLMFLIALSNFGIPNALCKLVASKKEIHDSISASIIFSLMNNLLLCLVCIMGIPLYARLIMKQEVLIPVLYACVPMLPIVMITGLFKGYFNGRGKVLFSYSAQITEELFRLISFLIFVPVHSDNPVSMACFSMISQTIGEIGSLLHLSFSMLFQKRARILSFFHLHVPFRAFQELLSLSVPMTASRMIGSLTAFLEPVLMIHFASDLFSKIVIELYSTMNTYILPLITLPSFFSLVISSWVLPAFSRAFETHKTEAKRIFIGSTLFTFIAGVFFSFILFFFNTEICQILYHKTEMAPVLKLMALPFSLYSVQPVLSVILHGASKSTRAMIDSTLGCILRLFCITLFCQNNVIYGCCYALIISALTTTLLHLHGCILLFHNRD